MLIKKESLLKVGIIVLSTVGLCSMSAELQADETALYDNAPEGSAFIRVINLRQSVLSHKLSNKQLDPIAYCDASPFVYLPAGHYQDQAVKELEWSGDLRVNQAYSLVVSETSVELLPEPRSESARKAVLSVYNFSDYANLSVVTQKGSHSVFPRVAKNQSVSREINPLKISFSILNNQHHLHDTGPVIFQAGKLSSLFLCGDKAAMLSRWNG